MRRAKLDSFSHCRLSVIDFILVVGKLIPLRSFFPYCKYCMRIKNDEKTSKNLNTHILNYKTRFSFGWWRLRLECCEQSTFGSVNYKPQAINVMLGMAVQNELQPYVNTVLHLHYNLDKQNKKSTENTTLID